MSLTSRMVAGGLALVVCAAAISGCGQDQQQWQQLFKRKSQHAEGDRTTPSAAAVPESQVAARVNEDVITRDEYKRRLELLPPEARPKTPEEHKQFLEQLVREELIVQDADARGLARQPKVRQDIDDFRRGRLVAEFINSLIEKVEVTPKDVEGYYQQYKDGFKEPARIRVRQIVVKTEEEAKALLVQLLQGGNFDPLARERSVGAGKIQGGDIGYVLRKEDKERYDQLGKPLEGLVLAEPLEKAAFALDTGGISGVIKGPEGFVILKCEERKAERTMGLVEVSDMIKTGLLQVKQRDRIESYLTQLRNKAQVRMTSQPLP